MSHQIEQPGRSLGVEQLGTDGDPARVLPGQLEGDRHVTSLGVITDRDRVECG